MTSLEQAEHSPQAGKCDATEEGHPRRRAILAVLASVAFMAQLDLFIVNVGIPSIGSSFPGSTLSSLSWVLNGYAIVFAALLVPAGRLADHFGRRRFLLAGVALFISASALCAAAPTLAVLVAGRALQAAGAAAIVPTSLGLLLPAFPARQHGLVVGIWAGVAAVAASAGPPLGGLLVALDWRWIFVVNVPIGIATLVAGYRVLPEISARPGARLPDPVSVATVLAAVTLFILGLVQGPSWGWTSPAVLGLFAAAALSAVVTARRAVCQPNAVIEVSLFDNREFTSATVALFLFFIAFAAFLLITVLYLQDEWHFSPLATGLAIAPGPMTAAVFALNAGRITARFGRTVPAVAGTLAIALAGLFWILAAGSEPAYATTFLPGLILGGAGAGLTQAPLFAAASTLAADRTTTGSAVLNMARQVGSAVGIALLVVLLASEHPDQLALFQRGWVLIVAGGGAATLSLLALRTQVALRHVRGQSEHESPMPPTGSRSIRSGGPASSPVMSASRARPASVRSAASDASTAC
jgi:EmrB/QacA subfamily drug resistance transporter